MVSVLTFVCESNVINCGVCFVLVRHAELVLVAGGKWGNGERWRVRFVAVSLDRPNRPAASWPRVANHFAASTIHHNTKHHAESATTTTFTAASFLPEGLTTTRKLKIRERSFLPWAWRHVLLFPETLKPSTPKPYSVFDSRPWRLDWPQEETALDTIVPLTLGPRHSFIGTLDRITFCRFTRDNSRS